MLAAHLALDALAHNTSLFYPLYQGIVGLAPASIVEGGVRTYLGHPLLQLEFLLLALATLHWTMKAGSRRLGRVLLGLIFLLLVWLSYLSLRIHVYSHEQCGGPADAAIVLGAAVWDGRPSPVFEERIKHALDLYRAGQVGRIVFTGGVGLGDRLAESQVARAYALARGVPVGDILYETRSRTTRENLREAALLLGGRGAEVLIVSDPLHMRRAVTIASDLGLEACSSPTPTSRYRTWRSKLGFLLRETYYYASYLLRRPFLDRAGAAG
jgi:uncharacterized SAM-binding protein YcdF (DUF218 family)